MSDQILTLDVGPSQLLSKLCDEIELEAIINEQVEWDEVRCSVSPGTRIKAMVLNILCQGNPLYKVHHFYKNQDVEQLLGPGITADQLNDDALGRGLDYLHQAVPWKVYTSVALSALKVLDLRLGTLHNDTTSISVYGEYEGKPEGSDALNITYGYSKQKRPDLKQLVLGMSVTPERIPILAKVEDGNTSDKKWNMEFIKKMREVLSDEDWSNLLYQADSALVTTENLRELADYRLPFLTRLPDLFGLSTELKTRAWNRNHWHEIGQLSDKKGAASYRIQAYEEELDGRLYRFVVVHSSQLDKQKTKRLERDIQTEQNHLTKAMDKLQRATFHCEADAQEARRTFEKEYKGVYHHYQLAIESHEEPIKRNRRGRPKKEDQRKTALVYRIQWHGLKRNEEAIENRKRLLSTFILMTNELDRERLSDQDVLKTYKGQSAAETRFRLLKEDTMIDGVFVKTPERIEALGIVYVMALLVYGMLEYRVRSQMKKETHPLILAGDRKLFEPTGKALLEQLEDIRVIVIRQKGKTMRVLPDNIMEQTKRIVELMGYDLSIYVSNPHEKLSV